jgi:hypothetical protein
MPRDLPISEIETVAAYYKEDLQREANRKIRRHDSQGALACIEGMEFVDRFMYQIKLKAGSQLGLPSIRMLKRRVKRV